MKYYVLVTRDNSMTGLICQAEWLINDDNGDGVWPACRCEREDWCGLETPVPHKQQAVSITYRMVTYPG